MTTEYQISKVLEAYSIHQAAFSSLNVWVGRVERLALQGCVQETRTACYEMIDRIRTAHRDAQIFLEDHGLEFYTFLFKADAYDESTEISKVIDYLFILSLSIACTRKNEINA